VKLLRGGGAHDCLDYGGTINKKVGTHKKSAGDGEKKKTVRDLEEKKKGGGGGKEHEEVRSLANKKKEKGGCGGGLG